MAIIDLGELRDDPDPFDRPSRSRVRAFRSPLWMAVASLLVLTVLAADASGPVRIAAVVPAGLGARVFFAGELFLVAAPVPGMTDGTREVVAYPIPESAGPAGQRPEPRWRTRLPAMGDLVRVQVGRGALLLSSRGERQRPPETAVLEARTGRIGWRRSGVGELDVSGRVLLRDVGASTSVIQAVDVDTGRTLWSMPAPEYGLHYHRRDGVIDRLVLLSEDGTVEVYDPASGALMRRADFGDELLSDDQRIDMVGDLLLHLDGPASTVTAYDLDGLRRLWQVSLPLASYVESCGAVLCAVGTNGGLRALDPATGDLRWSTPGPAALVAERADRLLVLPDRTAVTKFAVLDAVTGGRLTELSANEMHPADQPVGPLIGIRRRTGGRQIVVALDLAAARVRTLDVITGAAGGCRVGAGLTLVCQRIDGASFGVWRWSE